MYASKNAAITKQATHCSAKNYQLLSHLLSKFSSILLCIMMLWSNSFVVFLFYEPTLRMLLLSGCQNQCHQPTCIFIFENALWHFFVKNEVEEFASITVSLRQLQNLTRKSSSCVPLSRERERDVVRFPFILPIDRCLVWFMRISRLRK